MPGPQELIIILVIVIVLFGAFSLPYLASGVGPGTRAFIKAANEPEEKPAERIETNKTASPQ